MAYNPCGVSATSQLLFKEFLNNLLGRGERCLGRAVFAAKCSIISRYPTNDNFYGPAVLWTLLGDPALRIKHSIQNGIEESLEPQALHRNLTVSPNPCDASTTIRLSSPLPTPYSLCVYDASGRAVYSGLVRDSSFVIRTSSFPTGVYIAHFVSGVHCQTGASLANSASARLVVRHR